MRVPRHGKLETVSLGGEMGRFWTKEDVQAAVAQEVAREYGR